MFRKPVKAGDPVTAEVTVTNTGKARATKLRSFISSFPKVPGAPFKALRGFQRVHLEPGAIAEACSSS